MLAVDLRFPKPKPLRREFIEFIWKGGEGSGREKAEEGKGGRRGGAVRKDCGEGSEVAESGGESKWKYGDSSTKAPGAKPHR
jgi:hypothetical protein